MKHGISVNDFKRLWEKIHKKTKKKVRKNETNKKRKRLFN